MHGEFCARLLNVCLFVCWLCFDRFLLRRIMRLFILKGSMLFMDAMNDVLIALYPPQEE